MVPRIRWTLFENLSSCFMVKAALEVYLTILSLLRAIKLIRNIILDYSNTFRIKNFDFSCSWLKLVMRLKQ